MHAQGCVHPPYDTATWRTAGCVTATATTRRGVARTGTVVVVVGLGRAAAHDALARRTSADGSGAFADAGVSVVTAWVVGETVCKTEMAPTRVPRQMTARNSRVLMGLLRSCPQMSVRGPCWWSCDRRTQSVLAARSALCGSNGLTSWERGPEEASRIPWGAATSTSPNRRSAGSAATRTPSPVARGALGSSTSTHCRHR